MVKDGILLMKNGVFSLIFKGAYSGVTFRLMNDLSLAWICTLNCSFDDRVSVIYDLPRLVFFIRINQVVLINILEILFVQLQ